MRELTLLHEVPALTRGVLVANAVAIALHESRLAGTTDHRLPTIAMLADAVLIAAGEFWAGRGGASTHLTILQITFQTGGAAGLVPALVTASVLSLTAGLVAALARLFSAGKCEQGGSGQDGRDEQSVQGWRSMLLSHESRLGRYDAGVPRCLWRSVLRRAMATDRGR